MKKIITLTIIAIVAVMSLNARNVYRPASSRSEHSIYYYEARRLYHEAVLRSISSTTRRTYRTDAYEPDIKLYGSELKATFDYLSSKYLRDSIEVNDAIDTIAAANAVAVTIAKIGLENDTMYSDLQKASVIPLSIRTQKVLRKRNALRAETYIVYEGKVRDCNGNIVDLSEDVLKFLKPEYRPKNQ